MDIKQQHLRIERAYQRINTDFPCSVGLPNGELSAARILNLSVNGLKFSCGRDTFHRMLPEDQRTPGRVVDVTIEIDFELHPRGQPASACNTQAAIIHSERLSQDEFHIGVQFTRIDDDTFKLLKACVEEGAS